MIGIFHPPWHLALLSSSEASVSGTEIAQRFWQQSSELSLPEEKGLGCNSPAQGASQEIISHSGGSMLSAARGWLSRAVAGTGAGWTLKKELNLFIHECFPSFARSSNTLQAKAVCSRQTGWLKPQAQGEGQDSLISATQAGSGKCCCRDSPWECCCSSICTGFEDLQAPAKSPIWHPPKRYLGNTLRNASSHWDRPWPLNSFIYHSISMLNCTTPVRKYRHGWKAEHLL